MGQNLWRKCCLSVLGWLFESDCPMILHGRAACMVSAIQRSISVGGGTSSLQGSVSRTCTLVAAIAFPAVYLVVHHSDGRRCHTHLGSGEKNPDKSVFEQGQRDLKGERAVHVYKAPPSSYMVEVLPPNPISEIESNIILNHSKPNVWYPFPTPSVTDQSPPMLRPKPSSPTSRAGDTVYRLSNRPNKHVTIACKQCRTARRKVCLLLFITLDTSSRRFNDKPIMQIEVDLCGV